MRKYQQKQLQEMIKTLYEATDEIKRLASCKDYNSVLQLLADCQDMAIQMGNYIERIEGEGTRTVALLEEYCQFLYQSSVEIGNNNFDTKIDKRLQRQLIKIENGVSDELKPTKMEIAFISYKASMSDSIESIYLAAKADPYCDAFFVPIPYYKINADNSLGKMCYEGAEYYGDNIEITDWREYDIKARRPDVIFTFNPYDEGNLVTRVHPDFFCRNLRECTDLLVYVPYFVTAGGIEEHFCIVPGCIYAHKVIVQSKEIRNTYVRVFKNTFGDKFGNAEDKFLALGSPKFDSVISTKREDCVMPSEWTSLINGKKVVFYNTTVAAILTGNEQYLEKLRYVLSVFRNRDDVVLWWRPHPLSEATYESMRTELLEEYRSIVSDYKREGFGIYDDTPDLHRAIAWSDAYYGDASSLVAMYQVTDKPIMIQDVSLTERFLSWESLSILCADDNIVLFSANLFNAIFKMDRQTYKIEYLCSFPERGISERAASKAVLIDSTLYLCPASSKFIYLFDIIKHTFDLIEIRPVDTMLNSPSLPYGKCMTFSKIFKNGYNVYFVPGAYPALVKLDSVTGKLFYYDDFVEPVLKMLSRDSENSGPLFHGGACCNDKIVFTCSRANVVVEFDMKTETSNVINISVSTNGNSLLYFDGENYWLSPRGIGSLTKYNIETGSVKIYDQFPENFELSKKFLGVSGMYRTGNTLWVLAAMAGMSLKINLETDEITVAEELAVNMIDYHGKAFCSSFEQADRLAAFTCDGTYFEIFKDSATIRKYATVKGKDTIHCIKNLLLDCIEKWSYMWRQSHKWPWNERFLIEVNRFSLLDFVKFVSTDGWDGYERLDVSKERSAGEKIYQLCKGLCK